MRPAFIKSVSVKDSSSSATNFNVEMFSYYRNNSNVCCSIRQNLLHIYCIFCLTEKLFDYNITVTGSPIEA